MDFLMGLSYFALDALAILLLVAIWQRSRITGFLVLASSHALTILVRWAMTFAHRLMDGEGMGFLFGLSSFVWLIVSAVGLYGLWDIYRHFKRAPSAALPTA